MKKLLIMLLAVGLLLSCATAQKITLTDGALTVHVVPEAVEAPAGEGEEAAEDKTIDLTEFRLLGIDGENALVYADGALYRVPQSELETIIDEIGALPDATAMGVISKGDKSEAARVFQQRLTDLDYLSGIPDGNYGNGTATAVKAFQADAGLPQTGNGDVVTQLMLISMLAKPVEMSSNPDPSARFAAVAGEVDADLSPLYELGCRVSYDDIIGEGFITVAQLSCDNGETRDLDRAEYALRFGYAVDGNARTLTPEIVVSCTCLRRPMMRTLYLRIGDERLSLEADGITSALSGVKSVETAVFKPEEALFETLAKAGDGARLRISGDYAECDITLQAEDAARLAAFAKVSGEIL